MRDYESGFLALILTGVLMIVIGLGLMMSVGRSPDEVRLGVIRPPISAVAMRAEPAPAAPR